MRLAWLCRSRYEDDDDDWGWDIRFSEPASYLFDQVIPIVYEPLEEGSPD